MVYNNYIYFASSNFYCYSYSVFDGSSFPFNNNFNLRIYLFFLSVDDVLEKIIIPCYRNVRTKLKYFKKYRKLKYIHF